MTSCGIKANWQTKDTFSCALSPRPPPLTLLFPKRGSQLWGERAIKCQACREDVGKTQRGREIALIMAGTRAASVEFCPGTPHTCSCRHPPYPKENIVHVLDDSFYLVSVPYQFLFPASSLLWLTLAAAVVMAVTGVLCGMGPMWRPLLALLFTLFQHKPPKRQGFHSTSFICHISLSFCPSFLLSC